MNVENVSRSFRSRENSLCLQSRRREGRGKRKEKKRFFVASIKYKGRFITFVDGSWSCIPPAFELVHAVHNFGQFSRRYSSRATKTAFTKSHDPRRWNYFMRKKGLNASGIGREVKNSPEKIQIRISPATSNVASILAKPRILYKPSTCLTKKKKTSQDSERISCETERKRAKKRPT